MPTAASSQASCWAPALLSLWTQTIYILFKIKTCCRPFWLWLPFFHVEKQLLWLLAFWFVPYSVTKKGQKDKTKAAPAWISTSLPQQLPMAALSVLLSLPHMAQDKETSPCDPPGCNPPQKHEPAIYYKNFSADSEQISASCKSSHVMQPSQPLLPGLGTRHLPWQRWGVLRGMEITNIEETKYLEVCLHGGHAATAHPKRIQWLCCAFEGHSKQGGNSAWTWRTKKHHLMIMWRYKLQ